MKKKTKILLAGFSALLLVLAIAIFVIPALVDPNNYKTGIASWIKDKTGRDAAFEGDIKLSLFPWVGLNIEKMLISNKPGFQEKPFIAVVKSDIKVKLLPLLAQKIEIDTIALEGLTLNLVKDKQGASNWADLIASSYPPPSAAIANRDIQSNTPSALARLTVGAISIQNARVNWDNQQTEKHLELKNIQLTADKFVFGEPVKIDLAMEISGNQFKFPGSTKWITGLQVDEKFDRFVFNDSRMEWVGAKKSAPGQSLAAVITVPNATINVTEQTFQLPDLQVQAGGIKLAAKLSGDHIMDQPSVSGNAVIAPFNPGNAMKQWGIALPAMSDPEAFTDLSMKFHLQATAGRAEFTGLDFALDNSHGMGSVAVKDFAQPSVSFDFAVDTIDVDRYLAPRDKSSLTSPGTALAASTFSLPLGWLRKLDADGKLTLGKLTFNRMTMQNMRLTLSSKQGIVKTGQTADPFYQGAYSGNLNVDARSEKLLLALDEKLTHIHLEPLLADTQGKAKIGGIVTASSQLHGQGSNTRELRSNLAGQINFLLRDGYIKGFNLEKMIESGKNLARGGALPTDAQHDQTAFSEISGTAAINKGLLQNNDLIANTETLRGTGKGTANLDTGQLDYKITTKLLKAQATANAPEQVHDTPIVIHVGGTFGKPIFTLDVAALLTDKNKAKIERFLDKNKDKIDKLMNKLDKKLGPGASDLLKKVF